MAGGVRFSLIIVIIEVVDVLVVPRLVRLYLVVKGLCVMYHMFQSFII